MLPGVVAGALLAFVHGVGEFVASVLIYTSETAPISVEINNRMYSFEVGTAAAYGMLQVVLIFVVMVVSGRLEGGRRSQSGGGQVDGVSAAWPTGGGLVPASRIPGGELAAVAEAADFAVLPVGAVEWHGPHLPLGTDLILAEGFAAESAISGGDGAAAPGDGGATPPGDRATAAGPRGVLFPAVPYAACPGQTRPWPGTVSIRPEIAVGYLADVIEGIVAAGFPRLLIVNGHDANMSTVRAAMEWVSGRRTASLLLVNWFQLVTPAETAELYGPLPARGHGGAYETSGVLGFDPDAVRLDARRRPAAEAEAAGDPPVRAGGVPARPVAGLVRAHLAGQRGGRPAGPASSPGPGCAKSSPPGWPPRCPPRPPTRRCPPSGTGRGRATDRAGRRTRAQDAPDRRPWTRHRRLPPALPHRGRRDDPACEHAAHNAPSGEHERAVRRRRFRPVRAAVAAGVGFPDPEPPAERWQDEADRWAEELRAVNVRWAVFVTAAATTPSPTWWTATPTCCLASPTATRTGRTPPPSWNRRHRARPARAEALCPAAARPARRRGPRPALGHRPAPRRARLSTSDTTSAGGLSTAAGGPASWPDGRAAFRAGRGGAALRRPARAGPALRRVELPNIHVDTSGSTSGCAGCVQAVRWTSCSGVATRPSAHRIVFGSDCRGSRAGTLPLPRRRARGSAASWSADDHYAIFAGNAERCSAWTTDR